MAPAGRCSSNNNNNGAGATRTRAPSAPVADDSDVRSVHIRFQKGERNRFFFNLIQFCWLQSAVFEAKLNDCHKMGKCGLSE